MFSFPSYRVLLLLATGGFFFLLSSCAGGRSVSDGREGTISRGEAYSQEDSIQVRGILIEANEQKMIGNNEKALEIFKKAFKVDSSLASVHFEIAKILRERKERSEAVEHAKKAASIDPSNFWYQKFLADVFIEYGSFDKAAGIYDDLRKRQDSDLELLYRHANALVRAGKPEKAIAVYDSIENRTGLRPRITLQKQQLYRRMGDPETAIQELERLTERFPNKSKYYGIMAETYQKMGEDKKALETYERLLAVDPDNGKAHLSLSQFHREQGKEEKAIEHLKKAYRSKSLGIDKKVKVLLKYLSLSERNDALKEDAYKLLDILTQVHPEKAKTYTVYGDFLFRDRKLDRARKMFKKAVELDAGRFPIWRQILLIDQRKGMTDSLLMDAREAKEYFPNQPKVHLFEGIALMEKGQNEEAVQRLEYGKSLVVDAPDVKYRFLERVGEAYHRLGKHSSSDQAFDNALNIRDEDAFLLNNYAYYLSEREDSINKALKMSKKANELNPGRPSFLDTYGWILYRKGSYEKALNKLKKAIENGGEESATILEHYGDLLYRTGQKDKALEYWKKARKAGGGSEELQRKIREEELPTP